jgi:hypothetical protein
MEARKSAAPGPPSLSFVARPVWRDAMFGTETKVSDATNRERGGAAKVGRAAKEGQRCL